SGMTTLEGDLDWQIGVAGTQRDAHVHLPRGYDATKPLPVVLNFHGLGSNAAQQILLTGMNVKSDAAGFLAVHGEGAPQSWTADTVVPYGGNPSTGQPSVMQTVTDWASRTGCSTTTRQTSMKGDVTCVTFDGCRGGAEVNLCTVMGGGHEWPGGLPVPQLGRS